MAQYGHREDNPYEPPTTRVDDGMTEQKREENDEALRGLTPVGEVVECPKPDCGSPTADGARLYEAHMAEVFPDRYGEGTEADE